MSLHLLAGLLLFRLAADPPPTLRPPLTVELVPGQQPAKTPSPKRAAARPRPAPATSAPTRKVHVVPHPPTPDTSPVGTAVAEKTTLGVDEADLAGAATAGSGGGGGGGGGECDMPARLQAALRKDSLVTASVAAARQNGTLGLRPILIWNGDWVQHGDQEGKGLAAVREALMWDIAFAPEACRKAPVRGFVVLSLDDAPGSARLVVGSKAWLWSDLLTPR